MDVKELVEGYCQLTGRPSFTITVDEYIKFHQVALLNSPRMERNVSSIKEKEMAREKTIVKEEPNKVEEKPIVFSKENYKIDEKSLSNKKEETPSIKEEGTPKKIDNRQVALKLLKSIQG